MSYNVFGGKLNLAQLMLTRNTWQSLAYSPLSTVVLPPSKY